MQQSGDQQRGERRWVSSRWESNRGERSGGENSRGESSRGVSKQREEEGRAAERRVGVPCKVIPLTLVEYFLKLRITLRINNLCRHIPRDGNPKFEVGVRFMHSSPQHFEK